MEAKDINKLEKAFIEGAIIKRTLETADKAIGYVSRNIMAANTKVEKNKIVFMTYDNDYSCNPKYIAEEIIRQNLPWDLVWVVPKKGSMLSSNFPPQIRRVRRGSYFMFKELASAKIWIDNSINCFWEPILKKKDQYHIETWHGSMGIKRVGKNDVKNPKWVARAKLCSENTNFCISNSTFENDVYATTHWPNTPKLLYGHPRNDYLFSPEKIAEARKKVYDLLDIPEEDHILLYAPTFRDDGRQVYKEIDFTAMAEAMAKKFGGTWKILVKLHFHDRSKKIPENEFPSCVINATGYTDMQELIMAAEAGMTDYSSWAYDFVLTKRPMFIFAPDLKTYNTERGLYYPLETTPFPIATEAHQLVDNIIGFDNDQYQKKIVEFLDDKGCVEDGKAAKRVVELIKKLMAR